MRLPVILKSFLLGLLALALLTPTAASQEPLRRDFDWSPETLELFASLPVQDAGRVKPMDSLANLKLLTFNGKRTLKLADGTRMKPLEWMLDVTFFPEMAAEYPCFRIQSDEVLMAMGLEATSKRDWYTFNYLQPGIQKLNSKASEVSDKETKDRSPVEGQIIKLANDLHDFQDMMSLTAPARWTYAASGAPLIAEVLGPDRPGMAYILEKMPEVREAIQKTDAEGSEAEKEASRHFVGRLEDAITANEHGFTLYPTPSSASDEDTWWRLPDLLIARFQVVPELEGTLAMYAAFEAMEHGKADPATFHAALEEFHGLTVAAATERGEYRFIEKEISLFKTDPFYRSLYLYVIAFLLCAVGWLAPGQRWLWWGAWAFTTLAVLLDSYGITMRCIIRQRPPVVTLYDTILFITASSVLVGLFIEWLTKQRMALPIAALLGAGGMFFAQSYEVTEVRQAGDTMASVVAVLDTNYYLAIHVTTIALGYAGGLLAGALAHIWVFGKLFGLRKWDKDFYRGLTRMTYGVICFSLLFSVFGTIMGGVWANDSWGRFWGWDPKENGALLICLWQLLMLHARLGGYVRQQGFMILAILGGVVVSASWWGVNLLSVGLHSYGFTSGAAKALMIFWGIEAAVVLISLVHRGISGGKQPPASTPA